MIRIPGGYLGDTDEALEVQISAFGRHETTPGEETQMIRNVGATALGILALVIPYVLIAVFTGI